MGVCGWDKLPVLVHNFFFGMKLNSKLEAPFSSPAQQLMLD